MEVKFKLETLGYIVAEFSLSNGIIKIGHSSSFGDKFQELLNKLFFIREIANTNKNKYFPYFFKVIWEDDFVNYSWEVQMDSAQSFVKIKIYELSPSNLDHRVELLNEEIKIENLFNNIYASLEEILLDFGLVGYKKNWEVGNFPICEYITLKADRKGIELRTIKNSGEDWKQKINLNDELGVAGIGK